MYDIMSVEDYLNKFFNKLKGRELTISEFYSIEPLDTIVTRGLLNRVFRKARRRYDKYIAKYERRTGKKAEKSLKENLSYGFLKKVFLEEVLKIILGKYGITGGNVVNYMAFGGRIMKFAEKNRETSLMKMIKGEIQYRTLRFGLDEKLLKMIALASVKATKYAQKHFTDIILEEEKEEKKEEEKEEAKKPYSLLS